MRSAAVVALAVLLTACGATDKPEGGLTRVEGVVYRPAAGALIDLYRPGDDLRGPPFSQLGPMAEAGQFGLQLPPGDYILVARQRQTGEETGPIREGDLKSDPVRITVEAGKPLQLNLLAYVKQGNPKESLGETAQWKTGISGQILDAEGQPVAGVRVHVYQHVQMSERPKYVSAKTGPDGRYALALPEGGTFYLCARDKYGGPPKVGDLYGRYDQGTVEPSAVIVTEGAVLEGVDITVHTVW